MKRTPLLLLLFVVTWANAQSNLTLSEAKEIANTYYGSLQQMAKHPIGDVAVQSETKLLDVLGSDSHGNSISGVFRVPNDLVEVNGKPHADNSSVLITNYIGDFLRIAEDKKLDFSYKVLSNDYDYGPEVEKSRGTPPFARVVVQKTMKTKEIPTMQINDTMYINTQSKSVSLIKNKYRRFSVSNMESMSIDELLAVAHNMYSNRRFDEAYKFYQKALQKDPKNAEASYKLGVMSFKGEGCKQYPRKVRDYLVDFYWQKSDKGIEALVRNYNTQMVVLKAYSGNEIDPFPSNRLLTHDYRNHKFGYISKQGKMVIKQQYKKGYPFFANGTAIVMSDKDEWFLIDTMGRVKDVYLRVKALEGGKQLLVHKEDKSGVVNRKTGEWEIPVDNRITGWLYVNGESKCYWIFKDGKYGLISSSNTIIVPVKYNNIKVVEFDDIRKTLLCDYDESKYEQLQKQYEKGSEIPIIKLKEIGKVVVPFVAKCTALVSSDEEKWLLIDSKGKVNSIYENSWPSFMPIKERRYLVTEKNGKRGVLDRKTGEEVVPFIYHQNATMSWDDEYFRVLFVNDKSTYERLQKKYDYKIPEDELMKIGTLYKLPLNKDL